ncbi:serine/threonine protein kinase [Streptomyces sp. MUSC 14]|uniref:class III lanthionine synthetase LanKC n=1 Tax=Streptomyces sp. MUSC 14 TaxID=1354889 RepID=UPI0008F56859|nr:class III lanthionine synthetase LanKC [Streptomyces sp. MUSC 14]OIK00356.1 serine/threonine protein kinase [Streptomyces sp. MUSC 14]
MDKRYEVYALADGHFYDTPDRLPDAGGAAAAQFTAARRAVPDGWHASRSGDWLNLTPLGPDGVPLPSAAQGWKIHSSATAANAERIAEIVWDYCVPRRIPFKFVPGPQLLHLRNAKYAGRDTSGKFVTVYPADETLLHEVLRELGALLAGFEGPYILTDLRWGEGPLYVRYGAFARRYVVDERGTLALAVADGEGRLVPDRRAPSFQVPEWVTLPGFLRPHLAARNTTTVGELPYRIDKALHFSNGGGVYAGTDTRDGRKVVLKEARPHAGLAADGADAVTRLEREKAALERAAGTGVVPGVRDWFLLGEHRFLVMDFLTGRPLNSFFAERHPLLTPDPDPAKVAAYTAWALRIHAAVERAVEAVHACGLVFNDLHVFNIMVAEDERSVHLIDFEAAAPAAENARQTVAHPGFFAPPDRRGPDVDRYALACLRLALFLPVTTLFVVDRGKAAHLADVVAEQFPDVPRAFLDEAVAEITRDTAGGRRVRTAPPVVPGDWPYSRDSMVKAILASATPERDDRLFPGDIGQFSDGGGLGLAHGAAGVLYALEASGAGRYDEGERWLLDHTAPPPPGTPLGLYDGLAGVALVLDQLGHRQRALDLVDDILRENWRNLASDLHGGLAGLGLVLGRLADTTGEPYLRQHAAEAADIVVRRLTEPVPDRPRRRAGLLRGASGPALFLLRRHQETGEDRYLAAAAVALRRDLDCCVTQRAGGGLEVDEGRRTLPYLGDGSAGIGLVLDDYLGHTDNEAFARARTGILTAATSRFYAQPGLFQGRAGMILHLARSTAPGAGRERLARQIEGLGWLAMDYQGQLAFPGHQMMRLSMDLATGTAGCLLALAAACDDPRTAHLPFLPPAPAAPARGSARTEP